MGRSGTLRAPPGNDGSPHRAQMRVCYPNSAISAFLDFAPFPRFALPNTQHFDGTEELDMGRCPKKSPSSTAAFKA